MPCTGSEEFCRRKCIIDPESCGGAGNAANPVGALAQEMELHYRSHSVAPNWHSIAAHLLGVFTFRLKTEGHVQPGEVVETDILRPHRGEVELLGQ